VRDVSYKLFKGFTNIREFTCGQITITLKEIVFNKLNVMVVHKESDDYCDLYRIMESNIPMTVRFKGYVEYGEYLSNVIQPPEDRWERIEEIMRGFKDI
jgi:hypothetical protein